MNVSKIVLIERFAIQSVFPKGVVLIVVVMGLLFTIQFFKKRIISHFYTNFWFCRSFNHPEMKIYFQKRWTSGHFRSFSTISVKCHEKVLYFTHWKCPVTKNATQQPLFSMPKIIAKILRIKMVLSKKWLLRGIFGKWPLKM